MSIENSKFELKPLSDDLFPVWDDVVKCSKNGNFTHLIDFFTYHKHRFEDCSLIVYKKNKAVAVFPANQVNNKVYSHAGLTYAGLIYKSSLRTVDIIQIFNQLVEYYSNIGANEIYYKSIPEVFTNYPASEDRYALFRLNATLYRRDISSVILLGNKKPRVSTLRKRMIKKAKKSGVVWQESQDINAFHDLLSETLNKTHGVNPAHSKSELQLLYSRFPENIKLFTATCDGDLLAGTIVYDLDHIINTQYLASSETGRQLGALDLILSGLIEEKYANRQYFSFGISTENDGQYLNEGLIFQKEGFGGRGIVHDFYKLEF